MVEKLKRRTNKNKKDKIRSPKYTLGYEKIQIPVRAPLWTLSQAALKHLNMENKVIPTYDPESEDDNDDDNGDDNNGDDDNNSNSNIGTSRSSKKRKRKERKEKKNKKSKKKSKKNK
jgi:hypothetical protein